MKKQLVFLFCFLHKKKRKLFCKLQNANYRLAYYLCLYKQTTVWHTIRACIIICKQHHISEIGNATIIAKRI